MVTKRSSGTGFEPRVARRKRASINGSPGGSARVERGRRPKKSRPADMFGGPVEVFVRLSSKVGRTRIEQEEGRT